MEKRIRIEISPDGRIIAETEGIKGKECLSYIRIFENLMDAQAVDSTYTDEYFETELNAEVRQLVIKAAREEPRS
jgi:hypothetical protein